MGINFRMNRTVQKRALTSSGFDKLLCIMFWPTLKFQSRFFGIPESEQSFKSLDLIRDL